MVAVPAELPKEENLPFRQVIAYGAGNFAHTLLQVVMVGWLLYFYSPPEGARAVLLSPALIGLIRVFERIFGAVIEPLVGYLSDRTQTRWGRRIPWIALGAPFLCLSFCAIWFPPLSHPPDDPRVVVHLALALVIFWTSFTAVVAPYFALLPELSAQLKERVRMSVWMSVFEVLANVVGSIGAGLLAGLGAAVLFGFAFDNGYQAIGVIGAMAAFAFYLVFLFTVREPPKKEAHAVRFSLIEATTESLKNPEFLPYAIAVGGFRLATTAAVVAVPFLATELMGLDEEKAGFMLAAIILTAMVAFPIVQRLSGRFGKAKTLKLGALGFLLALPLMGTIGLVPGLSPVVHGVVLFVLSGFSVATVMVLPRALLADVIDVDETRTGYRREAMYNGMSGVVEKAGEALSVGGVGILLDVFGRSAGQPLGLRLIGIFAVSGVLIALIALRRYKLEG